MIVSCNLSWTLLSISQLFPYIASWKQQQWGDVRIPIIYIDSLHLLILPLCQKFLLLGEVKSGKTWHPLDETKTWEGLIKMENVTCFWDKVSSQT